MLHPLREQTDTLAGQYHVLREACNLLCLRIVFGERGLSVLFIDAAHISSGD